MPSRLVGTMLPLGISVVDAFIMPMIASAFPIVGHGLNETPVAGPRAFRFCVLGLKSNRLPDRRQTRTDVMKRLPRRRNSNGNGRHHGGRPDEVELTTRLAGWTGELETLQQIRSEALQAVAVQRAEIYARAAAYGVAPKILRVWPASEPRGGVAPRGRRRQPNRNGDEDHELRTESPKACSRR